MTLEPLLSAPAVVQVHAFSAMGAFVLGAAQIILPKGALPHRALGAIWLLLMTVITISSVFIYRPTAPGDPFWARFSFIHLFTALSAYGLIHGAFLLLRGGPGLRFHSRPFVSVYVGGLIVAGALAFMPGRIMHEVAFGG